jgi:hypothetical protein
VRQLRTLGAACRPTYFVPFHERACAWHASIASGSHRARVSSRDPIPTRSVAVDRLLDDPRRELGRCGSKARRSERRLRAVIQPNFAAYVAGARDPRRTSTTRAGSRRYRLVRQRRVKAPDRGVADTPPARLRPIRSTSKSSWKQPPSPQLGRPGSRSTRS